ALCDAGDEFSVNDLINRLELPAFAQLVTDLQEQGEKRGKYSEVIAGAIQCLESAAQARRTTELAGMIRQGQPAGAGDGAGAAALTQEEQLLALAASARNPNFASPRARRK